MIRFYYSDTGFRVRSGRKIKEWLLHCIEQEKKKSGIVHFCFVSEAKLLEMNKKFLRHSFHTDVITFDYSTVDFISGEIYICPQRIHENAVLYESGNHRKELLRVLIHGILHLCGYTDSSRQKQRIMRRKENFYIELFYRKFQ